MAVWFVSCPSAAPCKSSAALVWGLSWAGVITGCRIESEEQAERPGAAADLAGCWGTAAAGAEQGAALPALGALVGLADGLGTASVWSLGELCPAHGMPCPS